MRLLFVIFLGLGACSYKYTLDTPALEELRAQQAATTERLNALEKNQAETDGRVRVMWSHGK